MIGASFRQNQLVQIGGIVGLVSALAWAISHVAPERPLPIVSVILYLAALVLICWPKIRVIEQEIVPERSVPYWRFRYGSLLGYALFATICLATGAVLPSTSAFIILCAAALIAGAYAVFVLTPKAGTIEGQHKFISSIWARVDRVLLHVSALALICLAVLATLVKGDWVSMNYFVLVMAPVFVSPEDSESPPVAHRLAAVLGAVLAYAGVTLA
jgi:hypothetical protein